jgi:hypothetical protein
MANLVCADCGQEWQFEPGLQPPSDFQHCCTELRKPPVTARTIEHWLPTVWRELSGKRKGSRTYLESCSPTLKGAKLALDPEEYTVFLNWARKPGQPQGK